MEIKPLDLAKFTDNYKRAIDEDFVARQFCFDYNFLTLKTTDILYLYHEDIGAWVSDAASFIKGVCEKYLHEKINSHKINEIIQHITRASYIEDSDPFNKKEGFVNVKNGVYDIKNKKLVEHSSEYFFSYVLPWNFIEGVKPDAFLKFLVEICEEDGEKIAMILEGFAYCFIGGYPIQRAFMLVGNGSNGKGTLLNVLRKFLGEENCSNLKLQTITAEKSFAQAKLFGKLANIGPDLPATRLFDAGGFKAATGWDTIDADVKFSQAGVQFKNSAKMWFTANEIPRSPEDTYAFFRRWIIIEFKKQFPEGSGDLLGTMTTETELAGIFNILMAVFYPQIEKNKTFSFVKPYEETRSVYMKSSDSTKSFYESECAFASDGELLKTTVYDRYCEYCNINKIAPKDENAFWRRFKEIATFTPFRRDNAYWVRGIAFIEKQANTSNVSARDDFLEIYKAGISGISGIFTTIKYSISNVYKNRGLPQITQQTQHHIESTNNQATVKEKHTDNLPDTTQTLLISQPGTTTAKPDIASPTNSPDLTPAAQAILDFVDQHANEASWESIIISLPFSLELLQKADLILREQGELYLKRPGVRSRPTPAKGD